MELQHRALEQEVASLGAALAEKNGASLRSSLDRLEAMLTAHLKLEHTEFYPALLAKAEGDVAHQTVTLFQQNLGASPRGCWRSSSAGAGSWRREARAA